MAFKFFLCISYEIVFSLEIAIKTKRKQKRNSQSKQTLPFFKKLPEKAKCFILARTYFYSVFPVRVKKATNKQTTTKVRLPSKTLLPYYMHQFSSSVFSVQNTKKYNEKLFSRCYLPFSDSGMWPKSRIPHGWEDEDRLVGASVGSMAWRGQRQLFHA